MTSPATRSWPINSPRTGRKNIMEATAVSGAQLILSKPVMSSADADLP